MSRSMHSAVRALSASGNSRVFRSMSKNAFCSAWEKHVQEHILRWMFRSMSRNMFCKHAFCILQLLRVNSCMFTSMSGNTLCRACAFSILQLLHAHKHVQ
jgi:hypothetical protein